MSQRCAAPARASASAQPSRPGPPQIPRRNAQKFHCLLNLARHAPQQAVSPRLPRAEGRPAATAPPPAALAAPAAGETDAKLKLPASAASEVVADGQQLDPLALSLAASTPLAPPAVVGSEAPLQHVPVLDQIAQQLVKRIAWGGAGRKGAARIELGAGVWSGTTITVLSEPQGVSLELDVGAHVDGDALGERLKRRLESKGLCVQDVTVR